MIATEKITRAKIRLQRDNPFFAYLVLHLKPIEKQIETMGVDVNSNLYYGNKFVDGLNEEQLKGCLTHEVLHIAFNHLIRNGKRDNKIFNVASDIVINNLLVNNGFQLPATPLTPNNNQLELKELKITLKDIDKKSAEKIYDEIYPKLKNKCSGNDSGYTIVITDSDGNKKELKGFDEHNLTNINDTKLTPQQQKDLKDKWNKILVEAVTYAKNIGKLPAGMERLVEELVESKVNWKHLLYRYITNTIPIDFTYNYPSKKSISSGFYMPSIKKEEIEIAVMVDTSGSISNQELTEFTSEIINIAKSFSNIKIRLITCDVDVNNDYVVANGDIANIQSLKMVGGGGTELKNGFKYIEKNYPTTKLFIVFTDAETDMNFNTYLRTIWLVKNNREVEIPFGDLIKLEN